jgi:hypothetical protein
VEPSWLHGLFTNITEIARIGKTNRRLLTVGSYDGLQVICLLDWLPEKKEFFCKVIAGRPWGSWSPGFVGAPGERTFYC